MFLFLINSQNGGNYPTNTRVSNTCTRNTITLLQFHDLGYIFQGTKRPPRTLSSPPSRANTRNSLANHAVVNSKVVCPQLAEIEDVIVMEHRRFQVLLEVEGEHVDAIFSSGWDSSSQN